MAQKLIKEFIDYHCAGGWGKEEEFDESELVHIIRGTDFENILNGNIQSVPLRFEKKSKVKKCLIQENDILIEISGGSAAKGQSVGRTLLVTKEVLNLFGNNVIPASFCRLIRINKNTSTAPYIYYYIQNLYRNRQITLWEKQSTGISNFQFTQFINELFIDVLNIAEYRNRTILLEILDKKIHLNQKMNKTLEEIGKTLFKSWFIDFDPVRAKIEKRPTGLSKKISDLFPDSFEDSELGEIPKNYKVGKLEELAKYLNRGVSPSYVENNGVYLVNQKCIRNGKIDFSLCKQSKEKSSMNERYLEKYDILLNSMGVGTLGRVAMFYKFDKKITADALVTIIKGESVGSSFFIYYFLEHMEDYLNTISVGSTGQTSLKKEDILDLQMTIPPKNLLDEFGIQLSMFAEKKYLINQENLILRDLRKTLLPKLISGELKVSDAKNLIEEASIK